MAAGADWRTLLPFRQREKENLKDSSEGNIWIALVVLPWKSHMRQMACHSLCNEIEQYPRNAGMGNSSNTITAYRNQDNIHYCTCDYTKCFRIVRMMAQCKARRCKQAALWVAYTITRLYKPQPVVWSTQNCNHCPTYGSIHTHISEPSAHNEGKVS
jgi:hypothetical protein